MCIDIMRGQKQLDLRKKYLLKEKKKANNFSRK